MVVKKNNSQTWVYIRRWCYAIYHDICYHLIRPAYIVDMTTSLINIDYVYHPHLVRLAHASIQGQEAGIVGFPDRFLLLCGHVDLWHTLITFCSRTLIPWWSSVIPEINRSPWWTIGDCWSHVREERMVVHKPVGSNSWVIGRNGWHHHHWWVGKCWRMGMH